MFTGLIEAMGDVAGTRPVGGGRRLDVRPGFAASELVLGESVAINGVCLTVVTVEASRMSFDVSPETLKATNLGSLKPGDRVNLERAMKMDDRFGGHLVSGHVDGSGTVCAVEASGDYTVYRIEAPPEILRISIRKGSITVDGISLTIVDLTETDFSVAIIPHTAKETTIGRARVGTRVNLESDMIGKYVARLIEPHQTSTKNEALLGLLKKEGYVT